MVNNFYFFFHEETKCGLACYCKRFYLVALLDIFFNVSTVYVVELLYEVCKQEKGNVYSTVFVVGA